MQPSCANCRLPLGCPPHANSPKGRRNRGHPPRARAILATALGGTCACDCDAIRGPLARRHVYKLLSRRRGSTQFTLGRLCPEQSLDFRSSPVVARCLGRTAGGGLPGAAAHPHSRTVSAVAAVSPTDPAPSRSVPTRSARRTVGPPITTGHTPMRAEDPTARRKIPRVWDLTTIRSTARAPLLSRSGEWAMTAIADQTRDELD